MARKRKAIPAVVRREIARRGDGSCTYCGKPGDIAWYGQQVWFEHEIDHVIPVDFGGPNTPENLVLACRMCNRRKGNKPVEVWRR